MKFKIGQKVMITNGAMSGKRAIILSHKPSEMFPGMKWYELEIMDVFDRISYLEFELEAIN